MSTLEHIYNGHSWSPCLTEDDGHSFFHATFGIRDRDDQPFKDKNAKFRHKCWEHFLTYTKPPTTDQRNTIAVDDIPFLSAIENVKIIVFTSEHDNPTIIEPNYELLRLYPLRNKNDLKEAVIYFDGCKFSQMCPRSDEILKQANPAIADSASQNMYFNKLSGTAGIKGGLYQINLLTIFLLNALNKCNTWRLSTENKTSGKFDDLVFELLPTKSAILLQAKHRQNKSRRITLRELFTITKKDDFSLPQYFLSYQKIKNNFNIKNIVICTNVDLNKDTNTIVNEGNELSEDHLLYYKGTKSKCYTFKEDTIIPLLKEGIKEISEKASEGDSSEGDAKKGVEKDTEQDTEKNTKEDTEKGIEKDTVEDTEEGIEKDTEKNTKEDTEKGIEKDTVEDTEEGIEKDTEKNTKEDTEKGIEKDTVEDTEEGIEKDTDKDTEKRVEEDMKKFLGHLQFIANYPSENNLDQVIERILSRMRFCTRFESRDFSKYIIKKMIEWFEDEKGRYLTEVDATALFSEIRSNKFCEKLHNCNILVENNTLTMSTRILWVVSERGCILNMIKIYAALHGENETLFVNPWDDIKVQKQIVEAFEVKHYKILVVCLTNTPDDAITHICGTLKGILERSKYKKVVLISGENDELAERIKEASTDDYEKISGNITFNDLTEESQKRVLEKVTQFFHAKLWRSP